LPPCSRACNLIGSTFIADKVLYIIK
jgi:hypothetical protein